MQIGKIKCDECGFVGDLIQDGTYKSKLSTPAGWALVHSTVRIAGERELSREKRDELKQYVHKLFPTLHLCPGCVFKDELNISRMIDFKTG